MSLKTLIKEYKIKRRVKKSVKRVEKSGKKLIVERSKRVGVEFRIKSKQKINGKVFYAHDWKKTKHTANAIAERKRRDGDLVRVLPAKQGYAIYVFSN